MKKNKRKFEDSTHRRAVRSTDKRERKSNRHQTKESLHDLANGSVDKNDFYDMIDETIDDPHWR